MAGKKDIMRNGKKNGSTEVIHGKKVYVGKGTGEKVAKKATGAIKTRNQTLKDLFPDD